MGHSEGSPEREVHRETAYLKKIETFQIKKLTLHLQELEKQLHTKHKARRKKEIIKIRAELNDT